MKICSLTSSLVCSVAALWGVKTLGDHKRASPTITLNPPPLSMNGRGNYYYTIAPYAPSDGYITVEDALSTDAAKGMTESQFRDAITEGKIKGPNGEEVKSFNGFFNDWIIPKGFKVLQKGTKIPAFKSGPPPGN